MSPKKERPFHAYAAASQLTFSILGPLLIFFVGGHYAVEYYHWPDWVMSLCVIVGIVVMLGGACATISQLIRVYGKDDKKKYSRAYSNPRDNDYYDEYKNKRK